MNKLFLTLALVAISFVSFSQSQVYVNGYYRSNGTYVQLKAPLIPECSKLYFLSCC